MKWTLTWTQCCPYPNHPGEGATGNPSYSEVQVHAILCKQAELDIAPDRFLKHHEASLDAFQMHDFVSTENPILV